MWQTIIIRDINQALQDKSEHSRKSVPVTFMAIATAGTGVSEEGRFLFVRDIRALPCTVNLLHPSVLM